MIAANAYLESTTVNLAEYAGMNRGTQATLNNNVTDFIIVGDSRLAIQQSMGVIACINDSLQAELARHKTLVEKFTSVRYLHVVRCYNAAADTLATEALEAKVGRSVFDEERMNELRMLNRIQDKLFIEDIPAKVEEDTPTISVTTRSNIRRVRFADRPNEVPRNIVDETGGNRGVDETTSNVSRKKDRDNEFEAKPRKSKVRRAPSKTTITSKRVIPPKADDIDPLMVQAERRERISTAQNEETKWAGLKKFLRGEFEELAYKEINNAGKVADRFVLSEDDVLYYEGPRRETKELLKEDLKLRLVVPTTLIDELLLIAMTR